MAFNAAVWRFLGRRAIVSAAFYLAAVYLAAELAQIAAFVYVARPWAYLIAIPSDLLLLYMARDVFQESRERWAAILLWVLFGGCVLQVWLWASFLPHWSEKYNWTEYFIYANYARISTLLGGIELALILWPGAKRCHVVLARGPRPRSLWAGARHAGVKSALPPEA